VKPVKVHQFGVPYAAAAQVNFSDFQKPSGYQFGAPTASGGIQFGSDSSDVDKDDVDVDIEPDSDSHDEEAEVIQVGFKVSDSIKVERMERDRIDKIFHNNLEDIE
jgi:hypothetical protein